LLRNLNPITYITESSTRRLKVWKMKCCLTPKKENSEYKKLYTYFRMRMSKKTLEFFTQCRAATCCLHTGQKFLCATHCCIHWKWYKWSQLSLPSSSSASNSSCTHKLNMYIINLIGSNAILCFIFDFDPSIFKFMILVPQFSMTDISAPVYLGYFAGIDKLIWWDENELLSENALRSVLY